MNWHIILSLSLFGIVMGMLSLKGYTRGVFEYYLWVILAIFSVGVIAKNVDNRFFLVALITGLLWGFLNSIVQSIFFPTYAANNPIAAESYKNLPQAINPRFFVIISGIVIGGITGAAMGVLTYLAKKII